MNAIGEDGLRVSFHGQPGGLAAVLHDVRNAADAGDRQRSITMAQVALSIRRMRRARGISVVSVYRPRDSERDSELDAAVLQVIWVSTHGPKGGGVRRGAPGYAWQTVLTREPPFPR